MTTAFASSTQDIRNVFQNEPSLCDVSFNFGQLIADYKKWRNQQPSTPVMTRNVAQLLTTKPIIYDHDLYSMEPTDSEYAGTPILEKLYFEGTLSWHDTVFSSNPVDSHIRNLTYAAITSTEMELDLPEFKAPLLDTYSLNIVSIDRQGRSWEARFLDLTRGTLHIHHYIKETDDIDVIMLTDSDIDFSHELETMSSQLSELANSGNSELLEACTYVESVIENISS